MRGDLQWGGGHILFCRAQLPLCHVIIVCCFISQSSHGLESSLQMTRTSFKDALCGFSLRWQQGPTGLASLLFLLLQGRTSESAEVDR